MTRLLNIGNNKSTSEVRAPPSSRQWTQLDWFVILGSETGIYSVDQAPFRLDHAKAVRACLRADGLRVVARVVELSMGARAVSNTAALFVLAMASSPSFADAATNRAALTALPHVARSGTQLCEFAAFARDFRGWGRGLRSAIADWYTSMPVKDLADQMLKDRNREEWPHRDVLRLAHPKAATAEQNALFQWAVEGELGHLAPADVARGNLRLLYAAEQARTAREEYEVIHLIEEFGLTHEMIPGGWKHSAGVWEALLHDMPYTALLDNLGQMTQVGLLAPQAPATALAITRLTDGRRLRQARVHPVAILSALLTYQQGSPAWEPVSNIIGALKEAFQLALDAVEPMGQRVYVAIDASPSMQRTPVSGGAGMDAAMAAAAVALTFARNERNTIVAAFQDRLEHVDIAKRDVLDGGRIAIEGANRVSDASLPFKDALARGVAVDAFVILTDSKNWTGDCHPVQAWRSYRNQMGIAAKLAVVALAADGDSMRGPDDALQLHVAGFDASVPRVLADFISSPAETLAF